MRPPLQQASVTCSPRLPLLQAVDIHGLPTLLTKPHPPWHRARWQDDYITCTKRNHLEAGPPVTALFGIRYGGILPRPARRSSTTLGLTVVGPVSRRLGGSESPRAEGAGILLNKRKLRQCGTLPSLGERCRLPVGRCPILPVELLPCFVDVCGRSIVLGSFVIFVLCLLVLSLGSPCAVGVSLVLHFHP